MNNSYENSSNGITDITNDPRYANFPANPFTNGAEAAYAAGVSASTAGINASAAGVSANTSGYNTLPAGALDWNSAIEIDSIFDVLPENDYFFRITDVERGQFEGSAKLPPCKKAILTAEVFYEGVPFNVRFSLLLCRSMEWKLSSFFRCIGLKKPGERLVMDWNRVVNAAGKFHVRPRTYAVKDGGERTTNDVSAFYDYEPDEWGIPAPAPERVGSAVNGSAVSGNMVSESTNATPVHPGSAVCGSASATPAHSGSAICGSASAIPAYSGSAVCGSASATPVHPGSAFSGANQDADDNPFL